MKDSSNLSMLKRLGELSSRLNSSEHISAEEVAEIYNISQRNAIRDFTQRLPALMHQTILKDKVTKKYYIPNEQINSMLNESEELMLNLFLEQSKINGDSFYQTAIKFVDRYKDSVHKNLIYAKVDTEDIDEIKEDMIKIEKAILQTKIILCTYKEKRRKIKPLKLASFDGYWYVVVKDTFDEKIKTYYFKDIVDVVITKESFNDISEELQKKLDCAINAYFKADEKCYGVQLHIQEEVAYLFKRKKISNTQRIIKEYEDGAMDIELYVTNDMEIIPTIQRYMPHIKVIEPDFIWEKVLESVKLMH